MHRPSWFIVVAVASVVRQSCPTHHGEGAVDDKLNPCRRRLRNYTTPAGGRPGPVACHRRDRGRKPVGARRLFARAVPLLRLRRAASAERPTDRRLKLRRWSRTVSCGSRRSRDLDLSCTYVRRTNQQEDGIAAWAQPSPVRVRLVVTSSPLTAYWLCIVQSAFGLANERRALHGRGRGGFGEKNRAGISTILQSLDSFIMAQICSKKTHWIRSTAGYNRAV